MHARGLQSDPGADPHLAGGGVLVEHVERLPRCGDAQAAPLAHGEAVLAEVTADDRTVKPDYRPRCVPETAVARQKAGPVGAGQEAQVLRVDLARDRQAGTGGDPSDLRLGQLTERKAHPGQRRRRKRRDHVGLILRGVGRDSQQRPIWMIGLGDPRVMAGREPGAA